MNGVSREDETSCSLNDMNMFEKKIKLLQLLLECDMM